MRLIFGIATAIAFGANAYAFPPHPGGQSDLRFHAGLVGASSLECLPLVCWLRVENVGATDEHVRFDVQNPDALATHSTLFLRNSQGQTRALAYLGGPQAFTLAMPAPYTLRSGESVDAERLVSPVSRKPLDRWSGSKGDAYEFVPPGTYHGYFLAEVRPGTTLTSNEFEVEIRKSDGANAKARDRIDRRFVDFFQGRDAPPDASYYHGGKWWKKVDVSRFQDIQKILDDFPDSEYAKWIRFWKVYHHSSEAEALAYARAHQDFPLCDNLMFRVAQHVANDDARHNEALALLAELQRIFPGGDTVYRAKTLQEKLVNKKRRP